MRLAMKRSQSGGMALSFSETMYHVGSSLQPALVAFSVRAAALSGRWLTAMGAATSSGKSAQKVSWNSESLMKRSGPPGAPGASYGLGTLVDASRAGGKGSCTLAQLSPSSGAKADKNTKPMTSLIEGAAWEITAPPYECPTRTTGPSRVDVYRTIESASKARLRRGFIGALTSTPWACSSRITPAYPEASAKAPCTRTTVRLAATGRSFRVVVGSQCHRYEPREASLDQAIFRGTEAPRVRSARHAAFDASA